MGLAVAQEIIEKHGGHIRIESAGLDQGTTVTVILPIYHLQGVIKSMLHNRGRALFLILFLSWLPVRQRHQLRASHLLTRRRVR
jgi:chemotaxis protein histidine kinase CheA